MLLLRKTTGQISVRWTLRGGQKIWDWSTVKEIKDLFLNLHGSEYDDRGVLPAKEVL